MIRHAWGAGLASCLLWMAACGEGTAPARTGTLRVSVATQGTDVDPDGYAIQIGLLPPRTVGVNGPPQLFEFVPGTYAIVLGGLASNCVPMAASTPATVRADDTTDVAFAVICSPLPGTLLVSATTTGEDLDLDGYRVLVDGSERGRVPANGAIALVEVGAGAHAVALEELAGNCAVTGADTITATVAHSVENRADFDLTCTRTGRIAFVGPELQLQTVNEDGTGLYDLFGGPNVDSPAWSPDGSRIAFVRMSALQIVRADGSDARSIPTPDGAAMYPAWSPDGAHLAVTVRFRAPAPYIFADSAAIYVLDTAGNDVRRLTWGPNSDWEHTWSPDGSMLVFVREDSTGARRLFSVNADGSDLTAITDGPADRNPAWSPHGDRLAFDKGHYVYLVAPDGNGLEPLLPADPSNEYYVPRWSADGSQIMVTDEHRLFYVDVGTRQVTPSFRILARPGGLHWFSWRQ